MGIQHDRKYFVQDQTTREKEILLQANIEGDKNARYGLAITLLCKIKWRENTTTIIDSKSTKWNTIAPKLLKILRHTTFGTNTFRIPKNQACKNIGVDHWDCECPYPYGNKELHVTCKICSIDLKMYKLVNWLW